MIADGELDRDVDARYGKWQEPQNSAMLKGESSLDAIAQRVLADDVNPDPVSGRQEYLENLVNRFV